MKHLSTIDILLFLYVFGFLKKVDLFLYRNVFVETYVQILKMYVDFPYGKTGVFSITLHVFKNINEIA